jgi:hypothetical protein
VVLIDCRTTTTADPSNSPEELRGKASMLIERARCAVSAAVLLVARMWVDALIYRFAAALFKSNET